MRDVWTPTSRHSCENFTGTTPRKPQVLPSKHTPGLWRHVWRPISFILVVNDIGSRYLGPEHADHL